MFRFDTIGVPSLEVMASYGTGHQPGGAWQRFETLRWIGRIAPILAEGKAVLFEGQMRIAFVQEALVLQGISHARIILLECDDKTRKTRLTDDRQQPELSSEVMNGWSRYLHGQAIEAGCDIIDTSSVPIAESVARIVSLLDP